MDDGENDWLSTIRICALFCHRFFLYTHSWTTRGFVFFFFNNASDAWRECEVGEVSDFEKKIVNW